MNLPQHHLMCCEPVIQVVLKGKVEMRLGCFVENLICTKKRKQQQGEAQLLA